MGVWRTVGGRRIYIEEGQSLEDAMEKSGKFQKKEWDYPGIRKSVEKIESEVESVKSFNKAAKIRIAIDAQENVVNRAMKDIEDGNENGDPRSLMEFRRRLRMAKRKLLEKGILG